MDKKLIEQLNKLKEIKPEESFVLKSKAQILSSLEKDKKVLAFKPFSLMGAFSFALVLLMVVFTSVIKFLKPQEPPIASAETLKNELENMPVNIILNNINYSAEINNTINKTITAITTNKAVHIDKIVLEQELNKINDEEWTVQSKVDDLLNEVVK